MLEKIFENFLRVLFDILCIIFLRAGKLPIHNYFLFFILIISSNSKKMQYDKHWNEQVRKYKTIIVMQLSQLSGVAYGTSSSMHAQSI